MTMKIFDRTFAFLPSRLAAGSRSARRRRRASTLVETMLCLIFVLLPLLLGGLQFGMVLTTTHSLQQISRESGRFAAIHYGEPTFDGPDTQGNASGSDPSLKHYLRQVAEDNDIPWNDIKDKITVSPGVGSRSSGQPITVTIKYPMGKRSILGKPGEAVLFFAPEKSGAKDAKGNDLYKNGSMPLNFLNEDYTVASTFIMQ